MSESKSNKPILIVGGGISGITTAVELADAGKEVILIEKEAYLGGNVIKMNNYFPKLCPPSCGLEINFRRIRQNPRIKYYTSTTLQEITGEKGNFSVRIKTRAQFVKNTCTACGECADVCPEERPDEFNYNLSNTKAVYLSHEMAFPMKYSIDNEYCKKESCLKCLEICKYNAIDFSAQDEEKILEVQSVVMATGWHNFDASKLDNFNYSSSEDILTNVEFERILAPNGPTGGKLVKLSDESQPKEISFVQCAGSRDENHLNYCSAVCCSASLKHALNIVEKSPETKVKIFYIDLRVSGRNEDFLERVKKEKNIKLIKGKVGRVIPIAADGKQIIEVEDIQKGIKLKHESDMVILATGIVPNQVNLQLTKNVSGFLTENQNSEINAASCCKKPMDVSASVKDATAAALKAVQY